MIWILKGKTMTKLAVENWILLSGENEPQTTKYRGQKNSHKTQNVRWQLERICLGCIEWIWSLPDRNRHMCFVFHFKLLFWLCKLYCVCVCVCVCVYALSCVRLFVTPLTIAQQSPLSMAFSQQEYWVGCHFLLQGIFLTQESNLNLLHWQADSLPLSHKTWVGFG